MDKYKRTKFWLKKAESDLKCASHEISHDDSALDMVCFHAQQAVEKFLKAFLEYHEIKIIRTHVIAKLVKDCSDIDGSFQELVQEQVDMLSDYAVDVRYPDEFYFPGRDEAQESLQKAYLVKQFVLKKLKSSGFTEDNQ